MECTVLPYVTTNEEVMNDVDVSWHYRAFQQFPSGVSCFGSGLSSLVGI